eukprot:7637226-Lingulodinium_polyedra.AAC.1
MLARGQPRSAGRAQAFRDGPRHSWSTAWAGVAPMLPHAAAAGGGALAGLLQPPASYGVGARQSWGWSPPKNSSSGVGARQSSGWSPQFPASYG